MQVQNKLYYKKKYDNKFA